MRFGGLVGPSQMPVTLDSSIVVSFPFPTTQRHKTLLRAPTNQPQIVQPRGGTEQQRLFCLSHRLHLFPTASLSDCAPVLSRPGVSAGQPNIFFHCRFGSLVSNFVCFGTVYLDSLTAHFAPLKPQDGQREGRLVQRGRQGAVHADLAGKSLKLD